MTTHSRQDGHGHHAFDDAGLAELLDLDAEVHAADLDEIVGWVAAHAPDPTGTVVDLGAGTGDGSRRLARWFPDATVVAVDGSAVMVSRLGADERIVGLHADLDAGWPDVGTPDLVWAAGSLHHLSDPERILRDAYAALRPGGLLAAVEMDRQPRFLPDGEGLEDRLHDAQVAAGWNPSPDWTETLRRVGFDPVQRRRFTFAAAPSPRTARYAAVFFARLRDGMGDRLSCADRAALHRVVDGLGSRTDIRPHGTRTAWLARRPG